MSTESVDRLERLRQEAERLLMSSLIVISDFPKPGVRYLDFYRTFDANPAARKSVTDYFAARYIDFGAEAVVAIGNGGFTFGAYVAQELGLPLLLVRKQSDTVYNAYQSEVGMVYARRMLTLSKHYEVKGKRIVLLDDTVATGGTFSGAIDLLTQAGASILEIGTVFETRSKGGRAVVAPIPVESIVTRDTF